MYPLFKDHIFNPEITCALYIPYCKNVPYEKRNILEDIDQILRDKNPNSLNFLDNIYRKNERSSKTPMKVVHMSDLHVDRGYIVGSVANCDTPLCCRDPPLRSDGLDILAGKWGDYLCDVPVPTLESML
jgi:hypothetical protein